MKLFQYFLLAVCLYLAVDVGRYAFTPDVRQLSTQRPIPSAFMQYRLEQWAEAGETDKTIDQRWVDLDRISPYVVKAVLIGEDDKFWHHDGFDVEGLEQAMVENLRKGKFAAGGSTISQQLTKNLYLSPGKNPIRKLKEAILTWRIEKALPKRRILELYLNIAEWGDGIFGIEAAARRYYHKSAKNLSAMEAARLVSVLPNPIVFNPLGEQKYVQRRSRLIYKIMLRRGIVIPEYREIMTPPSELNVSLPLPVETFEANQSADIPQEPAASESNQSGESR